MPHKIIQIRHIVIGLLISFACLATLAVADTPQKPDTDPANGLAYEGAGELPCRLFLPKDFAEGDKKGPYPILIFLHGAGERGTDGLRQLTHGRAFMNEAASKYNCFVLAPQCPPEKIWAGRHWRDKETTLTKEPSPQMKLVMETLDTLCKKYPIDQKRIYIMGLSMGGFGTWDAIQRWPEKFAAAVPICGGGDDTLPDPIVKNKIPVWTFHGDQDMAVPVVRTRQMVDALKKAGGNVKYTEYPGVNHNSWDKAFVEPGLLEWITSQNLEKK